MTCVNEIYGNIIKNLDARIHPYVVSVDKKITNYSYRNRLNYLSCDESIMEMH